MKNKFLSILAGVAIAGLSFGTSSCADELDLSNPDSYDAMGFWRTESNFTGNLVALMNQWRANFDQMTLYTAGELRTDYYWPYSGTDGSGLRDTWVTLNQYDQVNYQFSGFGGGFYGMIFNLNAFLYYDEERGANVLDPDLRNYLEGMVYGMRAWCYFQLHKMYGTCPIRVTPELLKGDYDENKLLAPRSSADSVLMQVKDDLAKSIQHFDAAGAFRPSLYSGNGGVYFWNPAATQMLAGEVYLWSAKVSTLDHKATGAADVAKAKTYFENVVNNYGKSLMPTFADAINTKTNNTEVIFASYYALYEATTNWFNYITYDPTTGGSPGNFWQNVEKDGLTPAPYAGRLTYWYDTATGQEQRNDYYLSRMTGQQQKAVRNAYYRQFDQQDSRIRQLLPIYLVKPEEAENNVRYIADFNPDDYILGGCYVRKYFGSLNTNSNKMEGTNDMVYYRLPLAYFYLAEIANYQGVTADVEKYINLVRKRAYGDNWNEATYGFKAGSFLDNEVAILQEKTKEFFQEGQRWWDLRRLTAVKDGKDKDHLVFRPEGCIGYGLDLASHPDWYEVTANYNDLGKYTISTNTPLLDYATQKHIVLWPLSEATLTGDNALKQTPGYNTEIPWIEN